MGCINKQSDLEFERSVANEIFPALLDSGHYDTRMAPPPPPPPPSGFELNDSSKIEWSETEFIKFYERRKAILEKDTTKLIVAIADSTYNFDERARKKFIEF
ncbi:hypothetical protein GCM10007383_24970 [Arenibacter certesii]|uniref:Uncharacterized protein n=2 Tax=Arenibacter certesii TaxID=228955 RepID=A0A918IYS4_9FLAO|nr:hypothetical protein GCM10007383_24970 [Arenibacter certesii]